MSESHLKLALIGTLFITVLVATSSYGQSKRRKPKSLKEELMQLQRAEDDAENTKDIALLERLLTDGFVFTAPGGAVTDKKKLIEEVKKGEPEIGQTIDYDDVKVYDYGRTAVVNYSLVVKGRENGKDYTNRYRNTVVWVKQQGRWRMAAIHVSRIRS